MEYRIGERQFAAESRYLTVELRASNDLLDDVGALRHRLAEDGYRLLRGVHDPAEVLAARRDILQRMAEEGLLDPASPLMAGVANPGSRETPTTSVRARERLKTPTLAAVVYGDRIMDEPSLGLAPVLVNRLMDTIVEINRQLGTAVLWAEQNMKEALRIAQRAFVIHTGTVVLVDRADTLSRREDLFSLVIEGRPGKG